MIQLVNIKLTKLCLTQFPHQRVRKLNQVKRCNSDQRIVHICHIQETPNSKKSLKKDGIQSSKKSIQQSAPQASKQAKEQLEKDSKRSQMGLKSDILTDKSKKRSEALQEKERDLEKSKRLKTDSKLKKGHLNIDIDETNISDSKEVIDKEEIKSVRKTSKSKTKSVKEATKELVQSKSREH